MRKIIYRILAGMLLFTLGCANPLAASAKKDTDEAIYEDIEKLMDDSDWDTALTKLASLSSSYQARPEVIRTWAGVYAGKCGLDFISFTENLKGADISTTTVFKYFMNVFQNISVTPAACDSAQTKMEEIGLLPAQRTSGDNFFMAILGMVKMGSYLRFYADADQDGATDAGFDSCAPASLSDANLSHFITGMGLVTSNLSYLPTAVSSSVGSYFTQLNVFCGGACGITDATAVTAPQLDAFRDLLKTGPGNTSLAAGIETCNDITVVGCCP